MTTTAREPLTPRQMQIFRAIVAYWGEHGNSPTIREIGRLVGISSPNGVSCQLRALAAKNWIVWEPKGHDTGGQVSRSVAVPELLAAARAAADELLAGLKERGK